MLMTATGAARDHAVHDALRDQLVARLPPMLRIRAHGWRPWASACFAGARHWFDVAPTTSQAAMLDRIGWDDAEWQLTGSFVADVAIEAGETGGAGGAGSAGEAGAADWRIALLTVDD